MKNKNIGVSIALFATLGMISCTKEIELDLNTADPKVVIEATLPQQETAKVKLSKTVNFSDSNSFPALRGATVSITDNMGNTETLKETTAGLYESQKITGQIGRTYTLSVTAEGKTYTAQSTMPQAVKLMGLRPTLSTFTPPGTTKADTYLLFPQFTDPAEMGNSYRFIQSKKGVMDKNLVVTNDNIGNGQPYSRPIFSTDFDIFKGDVVTVEMQCLDVNVYNYFFSLNSIDANGPGGGTTPTNPVTNIKGGALGYFSAHTTQKLTVEVK